MFQVFRDPGERILSHQVRSRAGGIYFQFHFSGADSGVWQNDPSKYGLAQTYESPAMCSVVVAGKIFISFLNVRKFLLSDSGKIYHQALVDQNTCNDPNYIARIAFNVAKIFRDPGSKLTVLIVIGI